jgi:bacterial/archaeal transporter family-2 protein
LNLSRRVIIKAGEKVVGLELLSAFSGVLIAAQSRVNGALSDEMGDSLEAAIVSFSTGLLFVTLIACVS